jgi:hypothetical protein
MGLRGRAPTSKLELKLRGSWRARIRPDDLSAVVDGVMPDEPLDLTPGARRLWREIVPVLAARRVCDSVLDREALILLCESRSMQLRIEDEMSRLRIGSRHLSQLNRCRSRSLQEFSTWCRKFGLDPESRPRVTRSIR